MAVTVSNSLAQDHPFHVGIVMKSLALHDKAEDTEIPPTQDSTQPAETGEGPTETRNQEYPPTVVALTIMVSCLLTSFLVALDRTIVSTAIPKITSEFHSTTDIGWYGSAYMLTSCSFQLLYGRIYKFYPVKHVFLFAILLFEIGSAICGAAPSSVALILGRAIAGAGSSGIRSGAMQTLVHIAPLEKRPLFTGLFGAVGGIASVVGPLLGGAFTQKLSWRWCFYINLPFAAISILAVVFLQKNYQPSEAHLSLKAKLSRLDILGTLLFVPCMTCLILALSWGGSSYPWSDWRIILLFVLFGVLFLVWLAVQAWKKDNATVPGRIFFQRSIAAGFAYSMLITAMMMTVIYYLPLWFQGVRGDSAMQSGWSLLPTMLSMVASSIITGVFTQKTGHYWHTMSVAPLFAAVGAGLLTTLEQNTASSKWIAYQFLSGFGVGMGLQQSMLIAQAVLPGPDIPIGISVMFFGQQLGGAVILAIAEAIFDQRLTHNLESVVGADVEDIINAGATDLSNLVPASVLSEVLAAYNNAITTTLYLAVGLACATPLSGLPVERKSIKGKGRGRGMGPGANV